MSEPTGLDSLCHSRLSLPISYHRAFSYYPPHNDPVILVNTMLDTKFTLRLTALGLFGRPMKGDRRVIAGAALLTGARNWNWPLWARISRPAKHRLFNVRKTWPTPRWLAVRTIMAQWEDLALETRSAIVGEEVMFLLLGVYGWEYLQSLDVEYAVIRGRLSFRWPLIPYLVGRVSLLTTLILLTVGQTLVPASFACQPAILSAAVLGNITLASSSANLMIRTWLIWKNSRLVHVLLLFVALGHWTILASDMANIKAFRSNGVCAVYLVQPMLSAGVFAYTMCYDFLVLVLSVVKLSKQPSRSLGGHLRSQGLLYFAVAVIANILPTVFAFLYSTSMVAMTGCFAMIASTIVSCRAVRSLLDLRTPRSDHMLDESGVERDVALTSKISVTQLASMAPTNV